jgi:hypothetical protein
MSAAEIYRANAAEQLALAAKTTLQNRKAMHERSAASWAAMAQSAEQTADRTAVNAAAKAMG